MEARISPLRQLSAKKTKSKTDGGRGGGGGASERKVREGGEKNPTCFSKAFYSENTTLEWTMLDNSSPLFRFLFSGASSRTEPVPKLPTKPPTLMTE